MQEGKRHSTWAALGLPAVAAFVPGALTGIQVTGLVFFLNPHLPFGPIPVLRGVAFFGLLLGLLFVLAIFPFTRGRPGRALRLLPWTLTTVLAAIGIGAWVHASKYAFLLPSGINRRLIKAAIWLTLAAVVCFYTAFLHRLRRRPYGRRSWVFFVLVAIASIYVMMERREAFKPTHGPAPRATTYSGNPRPQLWVVGIESATLDAILPLAEQGRLPFFARMLEEGSHARIRSLHPTRRTSSWTTLAAGKYPSQHGVVGERLFAARFLGERHELRLLPVGIGFELWGVWKDSRPIDLGDRQTLTLWEMLALLEIDSTLVGWPLTALPPETPPPAHVSFGLSDRFFSQDDGGEDVRGAVWPAELAERARLFKPRITELDPEETSRFGPQPPAEVLDAFAGDRWREELTFFLLEQAPQTEAFFVVLPGLETISRLYFGGYSAVQFEGASASEMEGASELVAAYYTYLDELLAKLWRRSPSPRLLAVVSTHGVEAAHGVTRALDALLLRPSLEGHIDRGPDGMLMLMGEGIRPGSRLLSADLVDVVPTLLYGLGFPIARDFDGAVLTDAFETPFLARQPLTFLPSYETFAIPDGEDGRPEPIPKLSK